MSKQDLEQKAELCEEDQPLARFEFLIKKKRQFMQEIAKIDEEVVKIKEKVGKLNEKGCTPHRK